MTCWLTIPFIFSSLFLKQPSVEEEDKVIVSCSAKPSSMSETEAATANTSGGGGEDGTVKEQPQAVEADTLVENQSVV